MRKDEIQILMMISRLIHAHVSDLGADLLTPIPLPNSDGEQTNCIAILANALTLMLKTNAMDPEAIEVMPLPLP